MYSFYIKGWLGESRSVHSEMNAIISASRRDMLGGKLYLVGIDTETGNLVDGAEPCMICKRLIINAGITSVIVRDIGGIKEILVEDWINNDDSLTNKMGY